MSRLNPAEFITNKEIAKPPKAIPGIEDDELLFMLMMILLGSLGTVFVGVVRDVVYSVTNVSIPLQMFYSLFYMILFYTLIGGFVLLKVFKYGKTQGYVEQSLYLFFSTSLPKKLDLRVYKDRQILNFQTIYKSLWNTFNINNLKNININPYYNENENSKRLNFELEKRKKIVNLYYEKQKNDLNKKIESLNNPRIPSYFNEN